MVKRVSCFPDCNLTLHGNQGEMFLMKEFDHLH